MKDTECFCLLRYIEQTILTTCFVQEPRCSSIDARMDLCIGLGEDLEKGNRYSLGQAKNKRFGGTDEHNALAPDREQIIDPATHDTSKHPPSSFLQFYPRASCVDELCVFQCDRGCRKKSFVGFVTCFAAESFAPFVRR